jgi:hypothetical protein
MKTLFDICQKITGFSIAEKSVHYFNAYRHMIRKLKRQILFVKRPWLKIFDVACDLAFVLVVYVKVGRWLLQYIDTEHCRLHTKKMPLKFAFQGT